MYLVVIYKFNVCNYKLYTFLMQLSTFDLYVFMGIIQ